MLPAFLIEGPLSYLVLSSHMSKNVHVLKPTHSVLSFPSFFKQTSLLYIKKKRKKMLFYFTIKCQLMFWGIFPSF